MENLDDDTVVEAIGDAGDYGKAMLRKSTYLQCRNASPTSTMPTIVSNALQNNIEIMKQVLDNSILQDGGTIHLYLSAPNIAALGNHTDYRHCCIAARWRERVFFLRGQKGHVPTCQVGSKAQQMFHL